MENNQAYRNYCKHYAKEIPLFHQAWWWDAVAGAEQWQGIVTKSQYADREAISPFTESRKWGFKTIRKPLFTTYSGPFWAGEEKLTPHEKVAMTHRLWPELLQQLPKVHYVKLMLRPETEYIFPFLENGYNTSIRYTYTIDFSTSLPDISSCFRKDVKRKIRKFGDQHDSYETEDLNAFFPLIEAVYKRQKLAVPFSLARLSKIFTAAQSQQASKLFLLSNNNQETIGGILLFFDTKKVYLAVSAVSEEGRRVGAISMLIWHTIQNFHATHSKFDFCGSMMPNIAERNRAYGAVPEGYLEVVKSNKLFHLIK